MRLLLPVVVVVFVAALLWVSYRRRIAAQRELERHRQFLDHLLLTCASHFQLNDPFATTVADDITRFKTGRHVAGGKADLS